MKLRKTLNDLFDSKAKVVYLTSFHKGRLIWKIGELNEGNEFYFSFLRTDDCFPRMPVILKSSGIPWDIGNAYLIGQLGNPTLSSMKTLVSRAIHLKYYLQYLEDTNQHFLHLPKLLHERAPQKFKLFLSHILDNHDYSSEYINNILSTIAHFYSNIRYESLIHEQQFENKPFESVKKTIMVNNNVGLAKSLDIMTNNLRIKSSRKPIPELGKLRDEGSLRPLKYEEQKTLIKNLQNGITSIEVELMIRIALETGARQQSICTLSIDCIMKAFESLESNQTVDVVVINAGQKFKTDSKGGRLNRLIFKRDLINDLVIYINCERAKERRSKANSFYGDTVDNYVFLTSNGNPYLSAQRELYDRRNPNTNWDQNSSIMIPKNGQSLRNEIARLVSRIQKTEPQFSSFSFHDLRATSGMNLVRSMREKGYPDSKIFDYVRQHLNHRNFKTTESYLNFDSELKEFNDIQESFGSMFFERSLDND